MNGWGILPFWISTVGVSSLSVHGRCILSCSSELSLSDTLAFLQLIVKRVSLLRDNMKTLQETSEEIVASEKMKPRLRQTSVIF